MTTVIRDENMVYTDSCYGAPVGTERTRVYGEPKFFIDKDHTFIAAICGSIPSEETCNFITKQLVKPIQHYLGNYINNSSTLQITNMIENFYQQYRDIRPNAHEFYTIVFFTKDITLQINVKTTKHNTIVRTITYSKLKELVFGSGAAWWLAQRNVPNLTIEDKFRGVYRIDPNSGGTVNAFDLNKLKEIKL